MLFKLKLNADCAEPRLGYSELSVLAIAPWALSKPTPEFGDWCLAVINCVYICADAHGQLHHITSRDIEAALEAGEYLLEGQ